MKKYLLIIIAMALALCLVACNTTTGSGETTDTEGGSISGTVGETTNEGEGGGNISTLPDYNAPADVTLVMGEQLLELSYRGAIWHYVANDGTEVGITEDAIHPLSRKEALDVMAVEDDTDTQVVLHFWCGILPDKLTVLCWEYGCEPENAENTVEVIELTDYATHLEIYGGYSFCLRGDGDYVYMIKAQWDSENFDTLGFCGYLDYAFCTSNLLDEQ